MKPYDGLRVVEFATVGGIPFCAWWFAQQGALVTRIAAPGNKDLGVSVAPDADIASWDRRTLAMDLKTADGLCAALSEIAAADVLLEGFRPGVMERLSLGPAACHAVQSRLIYGRLVGWPRDGSWSMRVGHDINYIAMTGALHAIGPTHVPLNLIGDLGGGALYLAAGIGAALHARGVDGIGCVVDASMTDGTAHLLTAVHARLSIGMWHDRSRSNVIDGGVPWYRCYETADARQMAVGAIEKRFYEAFVDGLGLESATLPPRDDPSQHGTLVDVFERRFRERSMATWAEHFATRDACVTPVLTLTEARSHPAFSARYRSRGRLRLPDCAPTLRSQNATETFP